MVGDGTLNDPVLDALSKHINALGDMCNSCVKPWEPDSAYRAHCLFREMAKPYIDVMCEYMASRPKFAFPVAWCNRVEGLVPVGDSEDFLY